MKKIPTWTCVVALALRGEDGRWLMHRRPPHKHHGNLWEFPGGKVEEGELPADALVREIAEELGIALVASDLEPVAFAENDAASAGTPIVILLYSCAKWHGVPAALEGGAIGWFTAEEACALPRPPLDVALCGKLFPAGSN